MFEHDEKINNSARVFNVAEIALSRFSFLLLAFVIILMLIPLLPLYVVHASLLYYILGQTKTHECACVKVGSMQIATLVADPRLSFLAHCS